MKDIYINDQISLAEGKFANDKDINKIVFGPDVNYIPENWFNGCNNLKEIIFEGNIQNIEAAAFMNCNNLNIIKANNIKVIKDFAFHGCDNIVDFNIKEDMANNIIYGVNNDILSQYFLLPKIGTPLNDIPWYKINLISKKKKAKEYFKIGNEKELIIGSETYHVQILGFDHDNKFDKTGKAGITVGLKEIMTTIHTINFTNTNVGGWEQSEMRTYLQTDVYNALSNDVKAVIKTVDKVSDVGNKDTIALNITQDKLFLFSTTEVGLNPPYTIDDQGTKYKYFTDNTSRTKKYLNGNYSGNWWLRSTSNDSNFYYIHGDGNSYRRNANLPCGIIFGFCI